MLTALLSLFYAFFIVFSWNRASEAFEAGAKGDGYWNLFLSAFSAALLGDLIL
jgi:hypothetical protein